MAKRIGTKTLQLTSSPSVLGFAAVGAKKEKEGPLADYFDYLSDDSSFGEKTWEKAETLMQQKAIHLALQKCGVQKEQIDFLFAGDLLNQCISSAYASREMAIPFFGLYGACSTMAESLCLAGMFVDTGLARQCLAVTSSHFCSAERQFRFPLEYGGQRTHRPVDGHRLGRVRGRPEWTAALCARRDGGDGGGPGHHRHQQYGRGDGPRRRTDPLPVLCRHRP